MTKGKTWSQDHRHPATTGMDLASLRFLESIVTRAQEDEGGDTQASLDVGASTVQGVPWLLQLQSHLSTCCVTQLNLLVGRLSCAGGSGSERESGRPEVTQSGAEWGPGLRTHRRASALHPQWLCPHCLPSPLLPLALLLPGKVGLCAHSLPAWILVLVSGHWAVSMVDWVGCGHHGKELGHLGPIHTDGRRR